MALFKFKSLPIFASVVFVVSCVQFTAAAPDFGNAQGSGSALGRDDAPWNSLTNVPVAPINIAPETDFFPLNNVQPIVNVFPTTVNDNSGLGPCDGPYGGPYGGAYGGGCGGAYGGGFGGGVSC